MVTGHKLTVRLERRFDAAPERVFDAWLDPALIGRWMFGPALRHEEEVLRLSVDARMGGAFAFEVRRHGADSQHVGRYLQMNRPRRLIFTWGIAGVCEEQSRIRVDLLPAGTGCDLLLTQELPSQWADYAGGIQSEWLHMFDVLAETLSQDHG